jgi:hypothetical protein
VVVAEMGDGGSAAEGVGTGRIDGGVGGKG